MTNQNKLSLAVLSLLFCATAAIAQPAPPVVNALTPASGPAAGGTDVVILGANLSLPPGFACVLPCPTKVGFGGIEVTVKEESNSRLVATTPAHAAGIVEVTIKTGDGRTASVPGAFTFIGGVESQYEAILLPVYLDGTVAGSNGSQWKTDFWIRNAGSTAVNLAPWVCPEGLACPPVFPLYRPLQPNETLHNLPAFFRAPTANPARLLYVSREGSANVRAGLRVLDSSRATLNAGTELPLVRESQLKSKAIELINIPLDPRFRQHLRIYDLAGSGSRFAVRIYSLAEGTTSQLLAETELTATSNETGEFRVAPSYAEIASISSLIPVILPVPLPAAVRVEVEPLTSGSRYWAFVSVTNNETQLVTTVTPQ